MNAGDVWKIGETIQYDPATGKQWRYSEVYLRSKNVGFFPEFIGSKPAIVLMEKIKLTRYMVINGVVPQVTGGEIIMKFSIIRTISQEMLEKMKILIRVSEFIGDQLLHKNYGAVEDVIVGVNCVNPKMAPGSRDFETGLMLDKKYTKSKKLLTFSFKLNYKKASKASGEEMIDFFADGFLKSYAEIKSLNIKDFDIDEFYADVENFLENRSWLSEPYKERIFVYQEPHKEKKFFLESEKMQLNDFWILVEEARGESGGNLMAQVDYITKELGVRSEQEILGFEYTMRELLRQANHYNVMAVQKIVEGHVTDDSFLYFRCKLILYGRSTFEHAIKNPNDLVDRIDPEASGEALLYVADSAFISRFGKTTDKALPRDEASAVIDYDAGDYPVQGDNWDEANLPKRYPKLWKNYH